MTASITSGTSSAANDGPITLPGVAAPLIVEPLKNLVLGRELPLSSLDRLIDRVKFFCTVYDPYSGRYYFNYSLFMSIAIGIACFGLVLAVLVREWRRASASSRHL